MNMSTEPIRLPAWLASLLALVILPALASLLTGVDWRTVLIGVIAVVIPLLGYTESARARTDSPATIQSQYEAAKALLAAHDAQAADILDAHELEQG